MSGGSLDYIYSKVTYAADDIESRASGKPDLLAFAKHLRKVSEALHSVEWYFSGDHGDYDVSSIVTPQQTLEAAIAEAEAASAMLTKATEQARALLGGKP